MIIITVAPTGSRTSRKNTPYVPITPAEISEECVKAYEAGAAVAHIHVRDPKTLGPSQDVELYREVIDRIRDKCDMIIQLTTGAGGSVGVPPERRITSLELNPEIASLNVATMTFGDGIFLNTPEVVEKFAKIMLERDIKPEIECYDVGHINLALRLLERGLLKDPLRVSLVMGVVGGIPATAKNLLYMVECLPPKARWQVITVGRAQFEMATMGMILGGDIRVGMEDNIFLAKGVLAKSNAELVAKVVRIAKELHREIATPSEARKLLELSSKHA